MLKQQGILLLALGHPYYGRMAYNLAMSIKACDPQTHITLVYTEKSISHISYRNMNLFDNKLLIDENEKPFAVKLKLNELTPYERTIYLDVDTLWINKESPSVLFDNLKGIEFTGITEGVHDYTDATKCDHSKYYYFWADLEEIKTKFSVSNKIYQWRSEFIFFEKNEKTDSMFYEMQEVYKESETMSSIKKFANHIPDELAINIVTSANNIEPHKYKWQPTYWDRLNGGYMPAIDQLRNDYYLISCGSNSSGTGLKRVYDRVCAASAYKLKLQHVFPLISKKEMIINRQSM